MEVGDVDIRSRRVPVSVNTNNRESVTVSITFTCTVREEHILHAAIVVQRGVVLCNHQKGCVEVSRGGAATDSHIGSSVLNDNALSLVVIRSAVGDYNLIRVQHGDSSAAERVIVSSAFTDLRCHNSTQSDTPRGIVIEHRVQNGHIADKRGVHSCSLGNQTMVESANAYILHNKCVQRSHVGREMDSITLSGIPALTKSNIVYLHAKAIRRSIGVKVNCVRFRCGDERGIACVDRRNAKMSRCRAVGKGKVQRDIATKVAYTKQENYAFRYRDINCKLKRSYHLRGKLCHQE